MNTSPNNSKLAVALYAFRDSMTRKVRNMFYFTLKGCRRPKQIWTRRLWPSETLCIRHWRSMSSNSINFSRLIGSTPSTGKRCVKQAKQFYISSYHTWKITKTAEGFLFSNSGGEKNQWTKSHIHTVLSAQNREFNIIPPFELH